MMKMRKILDKIAFHPKSKNAGSNDSFKVYFSLLHTTHSHRQHHQHRHHHGFKYLDYEVNEEKRTRLNCDVTMVTKRNAKKDHHHRKLKNESSSFRNSEKIYDFSRNFLFVLSIL